MISSAEASSRRQEETLTSFEEAVYIQTATLVPRDKRVNLFSERANERTTILDALWIRYGCQISRDRNYIAAPKKYTLKVSSSRPGLSSVRKIRKPVLEIGYPSMFAIRVSYQG